MLKILPVSVLLGYSAAASSAAASASPGENLFLNVETGDNLNVNNANAPVLTNQNSDIISTTLTASPMNTFTQTAVNFNSDIITNTATVGRMLAGTFRDSILAMLQKRAVSKR